MAGKRKREGSVDSTTQTTVSPLSTERIKRRRSSSKLSNETEGVNVVWELADGSRRIERQLGKDKTLTDALYKVSKKLRISTPGSIRLSQVREGGHEVEIYDEFDYKAFQKRAKALPSTSAPTIKVYPGITHREHSFSPFPRASSSTPYTAPSTPFNDYSQPEAGPSSGPRHIVDTPTFNPAPYSVPVSPSHSILRHPTDTSSSAPSSQSKKKKVSIASLPGTPATKDKLSSKKKGKLPAQPVNMPSPPIVATDSTPAKGPHTVPPGMEFNANMARILALYKPSVPSPLGRSTNEPRPEAANSPAAASKKKPGRLAKATTKNPRKSVIEAGPSETVDADSANTRRKAKRAATRQRRQSQISDPSVDDESASPPPQAATTPPVPSTSPVDDAQEVSPLEPESSTDRLSKSPSKPTTISLASPYNLYNKPAEPTQSEGDSSSTFESPRKSGKKSKPKSQSTIEGTLESSQPQSVDAVQGVTTPEGAGTGNSTTTANPGAAEDAIESTSEDLHAAVPSKDSRTGDAETPQTSNTTAPQANPKPARKRGRPTKTATLAHNIMAEFRAKRAADASREAATEDNQAGSSTREVNASPVASVVTETAGVVPAAPPQAAPNEVSPTPGSTESTEVSVSTAPQARPASSDPMTPDSEPAGSAAPTGADHMDVPKVPLAESSPPPAASDQAELGSAEVDQDMSGGVVAKQQPGNTDEQAQASASTAKRPPINSRKKKAAPSSPKMTGWWASGELEGNSGPIDDRPITVILASRSACQICGKTPSHLQKDCPDVKKGSENLQAILTDRQKQVEEAQKIVDERAAARRQSKGRRSKADEEEDNNNLEMVTESVDVIKKWIDLSRKRETMKRRVEGESSVVSQDTPVIASAVAINPHPEAISTTRDNTLGLADTLLVAEASEANDDELSSIGLTVQDANSSFAPTSSKPQPTPEKPNLAREPSAVHFLHQKALARAKRRPRAAGSLSGLSASDAVIETGSSDSESDSPVSSIRVLPSIGPSSDVSTSDSESDLGSGEGSRSRTGSDADAEGDLDMNGDDKLDTFVEDEAAVGNDQDSQNGSDNSSDEPQSSSESETATQSTRRSTSPSSSSSMSDEDPETSFLRIMQKPLSAKEKKQARLSAASMQPSQSLEMLSEGSDVGAEDDDEEEEVLPPHLSQRRRGSDSSIDMGQADDDEEYDRADAHSDIQPSSPTQPPPVIAADEEDVEPPTQIDAYAGHATSPSRATPRLRSFVDVDRQAGTSPEINNLDGAIALEDAIQDEEMSGVLASESIEEKRPQHVISQGLPSPPLSHEDEAVVATQLVEEATPRPRRSARARNSATVSPTAGKMALPNGNGVPSHSTGIARRLRSASREIPEPDHSTPKPTRASSRSLPSSQIDQLESSQIIPASSQQSEENTPSLRRSTRPNRSPLFMSQPSQPLATQHYTLHDSSLTNGRVTSPIAEEDEEGAHSVASPAEDDANAESGRSSSDSEDDTTTIPIIRPLAAIRRSASQGATISMPTLSSLDTSILRNGRSNRLTPTTASQPIPSSRSFMTSNENESESEISSSDEEEVPASRRGRYATGRAGRKARPKTNGVMRGW